MSAGSDRLASWALRGLPMFTVLVVCFALFVVGASRPYVSARLFGGPLEGHSEYHLRLSVAERLGGIEAPRQLGVRVFALASDGREASWGGATDPQGNAQVALSFDSPTQGPLDLRVELDGEQAELPAGYLLARGKVSAPAENWRAGLTRGASWTARSKGELGLRVAAARGVLAVPFRDTLWVEVTRAGEPVAGANIELRLEGATLVIEGTEGGSSRQLVSNERGLASTDVIPDGHIVTLEVRASVEQPGGPALSGRLGWQLPVVPGALDARLDDENRLVVRSPIERDFAYMAIVDEAGRWGGATIPLTPTQDGISRGETRLTDSSGLLRSRWALVSSEPDLKSGGAVGWPLTPKENGPTANFMARELRLLDGFPAAYERNERRMSRARWLAGGVALLSSFIVVVLMVLRTRRSALKLETHLREQELLGNTDGAESGRFQPPTYSWGLLLGVLSVGLGFLLLGLLVLYRAH